MKKQKVRTWICCRVMVCSSKPPYTPPPPHPHPNIYIHTYIIYHMYRHLYNMCICTSIHTYTHLDLRQGHGLLEQVLQHLLAVHALLLPCSKAVRGWVYGGGSERATRKSVVASCQSKAVLVGVGAGYGVCQRVGEGECGARMTSP